MLATGELVDQRYRLLERRGRGGMAEVYRAVDEETGRPVAVKRLTGTTSSDAQRFRAEAQVLRLLAHPGIVRLRDAGTDDGVPYLVLDYVDGPSLAELLADGPVELHRAIGIGREIAAALAHAHGLDVVHRDVKPSNILLDDSGRASLGDFGIALMPDLTPLTATGLLVGSAPYLAPEQVVGAGATPASDVYALGLVLIECITGSKCYPGGQIETAVARLHRPPAVPSGLPGWLQHGLSAMTARDPRWRPSASAVAAAFEHQCLEPLLTDTAPLSLWLEDHVDPDTVEDIPAAAPRPGEPSWQYRALVLAAVFVVSLVAWLALPDRRRVADTTPTVPPSSIPPAVTAPPPSEPPVTTSEPPPSLPQMEADDGDDNSGPGSGNGHGRDKNNGEGGGNDG